MIADKVGLANIGLTFLITIKLDLLVMAVPIQY